MGKPVTLMPESSREVAIHYSLDGAALGLERKKGASAESAGQRAAVSHHHVVRFSPQN
jgi:hypothetical protein